MQSTGVQKGGDPFKYQGEGQKLNKSELREIQSRHNQSYISDKLALMRKSRMDTSIYLNDCLIEESIFRPTRQEESVFSNTRQSAADTQKRK